MRNMESILGIDGSVGGGQVLRTALSLSMITGQPFRISGIRGQRCRPGLLRQHLTAVQAAAVITGAQTKGAVLNSVELEFRPGNISAGNYSFAIGTAGSTTLVMQTLVPALLKADGPSTLTISGGTHNPSAPAFEFIERSWLPLLRRMGARIEVSLVRTGFAPAGGGMLEVKVWPSTLVPIRLDPREESLGLRAHALVSAIPASVASRELDRVAFRLGLDRRAMYVTEVTAASGPGNVLFIENEQPGLTQVFSGIGFGRAQPDDVADEAIDHYLQWAESGAAIGHRLADQLLLPMALAGGGGFTTDRLSGHLKTNTEVIRGFLPVEIGMQESANQVRVSVM